MMPLKNEKYEKELILSDDNMRELGFCRFYYPGEISAESPTWNREILWERAAGQHQAINIQIPSRYLIPLSVHPKERLATKECYISPAGFDIGPLKLLSRRAGWNQTRSDLELLVSLDTRANFLACYRSAQFDIPLGSGTVMPVADQLYWIGMILVHPEVRRQGIARKIMQHCIGYVRQNAPRAWVGLDATPQGVPLYSQLGFKTIARLWRCQIDTGNVKSKRSRVEIRKIRHAKEIIDYAGNKQLPVSQKLLAGVFMLYPQGCFSARAKQGCAGFVMSRPGRIHPFIGPIFADEAEIARSLFIVACEYWYRQGYEKVFIDVREDHFADRKRRSDYHDPGTEHEKPLSDHLLSDSIHPVRHFSRMQMAMPANDSSLPDKNSFLYATFGPEFG